MRLLVLVPAAALVVVLGVWAWTTVVRPAPASDRLAGVAVAVTGFTIDDLPGDQDRLNLTVSVTSDRTIDDCLGFALDEPFAGRRVEPADGACVKPVAGVRDVALVFDRLTNDDRQFPDHTLVWGIPGGRCGPILELFGVCVVEQAGTATVELPAPPGAVSFPPFGSFGPIFSFPAYSFAP